MDISSEYFDVFLHIPKTAGTSLGSILDSAYGRRRVVLYYNQPNRQLLENLDYFVCDPRNDYGAIIGHFGSEIIGQVVRRPTRYTVFLRDPVRRTISDYYERKSARPQDFIGPENREITLSESLDVHRDWYVDHQTRYLAGLTNDGRDPNPGDLDLALKNLEDRIDFIGLVEQFDESIQLLSDELGWTHTTVEKKNVAAAYDLPSEAILEKIENITRLDRLLYRRASELLTKKLNARGNLKMPAAKEPERVDGEEPRSAIF